MTKDEALKLALEALVEMSPSGPTGSAIWHKQMSAIKAAGEALAQPSQEPVAYAGIKMWVGNQQVVQLFTETELQYATRPWFRMLMDAEKCIAALKEKNT